MRNVIIGLGYLWAQMSLIPTIEIQRHQILSAFLMQRHELVNKRMLFNLRGVIAIKPIKPINSDNPRVLGGGSNTPVSVFKRAGRKHMPPVC